MIFSTYVLCIVSACLTLSQSTRMSSMQQMQYAAVPGESSRQCGRNTPCMWAVCQWRQTLRADDESCEFLYFCQCTGLSTCQQTNIKPGPGNLLTFYHYCLPPNTEVQR